jgi:hypothetical protein
MRMIAATILAVLPLAADATPSQLAPQASGASMTAKCDRFGRMEQATVLRQSGPLAQRLDRLPPGDLHLTVEREVNGCHEPVIVRQNIGGPASQRR